MIYFPLIWGTNSTIVFQCDAGGTDYVSYWMKYRYIDIDPDLRLQEGTIGKSLNLGKSLQLFWKIFAFAFLCLLAHLTFFITQD